MRSETVIKHGPEGFAGMREAGHLAAAVLDMITPHVTAGVSTDYLNGLCHDFILANDCSGHFSHRAAYQNLRVIG